jgi:hypothetical protein
MYQRYDELSMRILNGMKVEGKWKSSVSTTRTSIRKLREYMQGEGLPYTPEIAARWLEENVRPLSSHEVYKQIRFVHYRIAILFDSEQNLRELFYKDLQSDYDRLPFWARDVVSGFLAHYRSKQKCIDLFKAGASTFLYRQIQDGLDSISSLSYGSCAEYYRRYGLVRGVRRFLTYLGSQKMIAPYVQDSYNFMFSKRMIKVPLDSPLRESSIGYSLLEYQSAQCKAFELLKAQGYASSVRKALISGSNELGVFLGLNGLSYSEEVVSFFIEKFRRNISPNIDSIRRGLLSIGYLLSHAEEDQVPLVFPTTQTRALPTWAEQDASAYVAIRERSGKCRSTLDMDRSSLTRFLSFLDSSGCQGFDDVSVERIKGFNVQDRHSTNEGKNAYNVRIVSVNSTPLFKVQ